MLCCNGWEKFPLLINNWLNGYVNFLALERGLTPHHDIQCNLIAKCSTSQKSLMGQVSLHLIYRTNIMHFVLNCHHT